MIQLAEILTQAFILGASSVSFEGVKNTERLHPTDRGADLVVSYHDVPSLHSRCTDFKLVTLTLDPDASAAATSSESYTVSRPF